MGIVSSSSVSRSLLRWRGTNTKIHPPTRSSRPSLQDFRTSSREYVNPVDYEHPHDSMARFADLLTLRHDANRTRHACYRQLRLIHDHFQLDPAALTEARVREWFLHLKLNQPAGAGAAALKYLGTYLTRTAISDARLLKVTATQVTFRWQDREHDRTRKLQLPGVEFVRRYLRHVLPKGLRSVRYYGFCHPRARAHRLRVRFLAGAPVSLGATPSPTPKSPPPCCPRCDRPMKLLGSIPPPGLSRAPPGMLGQLRPVQLQPSF